MVFDYNWCVCKIEFCKLQFYKNGILRHGNGNWRVVAHWWNSRGTSEIDLIAIEGPRPSCHHSRGETQQGKDRTSAVGRKMPAYKATSPRLSSNPDGSVNGGYVIPFAPKDNSVTKDATDECGAVSFRFIARCDYAFWRNAERYNEKWVGEMSIDKLCRRNIFYRPCRYWRKKGSAKV